MSNEPQLSQLPRSSRTPNAKLGRDLKVTMTTAH